MMTSSRPDLRLVFNLTPRLGLPCLGCLGSLVFNLTPLLGYPNNDVARSRGFPLPLQSQHVRHPAHSQGLGSNVRTLLEHLF